MKDTSLSNNNRVFNPVHKSSLFFGKWEYCIRFSTTKMSVLRDLNLGKIDQQLDHWLMFMPAAQITEIKKNLHAICSLLTTTEHEFFKTVSGNTMYVYTNSMKLIDQLDVFDFLSHKVFTQAVITYTPEVISLKHPRHQFRTYFKWNYIDKSQCESLRNFVKNYPGQLVASRSLKNALERNSSSYIANHHYIDHNDIKYLTILSIICPGLVRKTLPIEQTK